MNEVKWLRIAQQLERENENLVAQNARLLELNLELIDLKNHHSYGNWTSGSVASLINKIEAELNAK